jgi:hypothetical protein
MDRPGAAADPAPFGHTLTESMYGGNTRARGASSIEYVRVSLCFDIAPISSTFLRLDIENVSMSLSDRDRTRTIGNCDGDGEFEFEFEGDSVFGSSLGAVVAVEVSGGARDLFETMRLKLIKSFLLSNPMPRSRRLRRSLMEPGAEIQKS